MLSVHSRWEFFYIYTEFRNDFEESWALVQEDEVEVEGNGIEDQAAAAPAIADQQEHPAPRAPKRTPLGKLLPP